MDRRYLGIDFSGDARKWGPALGMHRRTVWIASVLQSASGRLVLNELRSVQDLPKGADHPFDRLVQLLSTADFVAAGIDAPFSIPARYLPEGGWKDLIEHIDSIACGSRPFPKGERLLAFSPPMEKKPLRKTELIWKRCSPRSTLWNGHRGGAPFTVACLKLIGRTQCSIWPWASSGPRLLVEAYPAAQLEHWGLRGQSRSTAIEYLSGKMDLGCHAAVMNDCADAFDAVVCSFGAIAAVAKDNVPSVERQYALSEGWIAVSP
jgi:hypothetical protein